MSKLNIKPKYLSLTEENNALDYLEKAYYYICKTEIDDMSWKWVILTLHGTLYGFAICALKGTNPDRVIKKRRLINFNEALNRCQEPEYMHMTAMSKCLQLKDKQKNSIQYLHKTFRNYFVHYIPKAWYIELHGMPQISIDILNVIHFLALDTGNYIDFTEKQRKRVESIVFQSKEILKKSLLYKESELLQKRINIK